jgi:hypothetical protein
MKARRHLLVAVMAAMMLPGAAFAQGSALSVDGLRGRVAVLLFGGLADPQSPDELPVLQRLASRYEGRGVEVIWVSVDPQGEVSDADLRSYAVRYGYSGRIARDASGSILKSFSAGRRPQLPTIVILDPAGAVAGRPIGGFDRDADLVNKIAAVVDPLL